MNPLRSRMWRTIILFSLGLAASFLIALIFAPLWPGFCDEAIVARPCESVHVQTMAGYVVIALGILTIIFGPIAGSMIDLAVNGSKWETPRGTETVITNVPILIGAIYVVVGVAVVATT
ncbi:MAG: hypothetical protein BMS9Abin17_1289 [Acidimicrobiia bacterium]|nr:MAG: hypothetical protein BMS9Abin17_1289 [Acidimicrobiia bacterium]